MSPGGGTADASGTAFELRLGVEFCVYILAGELAGLEPGPPSIVQPQAPETVDDLVVCFLPDVKWVFQAKAGAISVSWKPGSRFGEGLRQLHLGASCGQVDLSPASLDRAFLAVDHRARRTVLEFGDWLDKARRHLTWSGFAAACNSAQEREYISRVPQLLDAEPNDDLLAFLKKTHVWRMNTESAWRMDLRRVLLQAGAPDVDSADRALDVLSVLVQDARPHSGQLGRDEIVRACEKAGIVRLAPSYQVLRRPEEGTLHRLLDVGPVRLDRFVERPELAASLSSDAGALIVGKPGIGKSAALVRLASQATMPAVVILKGFGAADVDRVTTWRQADPYCLIWDDIHVRPDLFVSVVEKLAERRDPVRVLCSVRAQELARVEETLPPGFWKRAGIGDNRITLQDFQHEQAEEMCDALAAALHLEMDGEARQCFVEHILRGDGGPLFAAATALLLQSRVGNRIRAGDIMGQPLGLHQVWRALYQRLDGKPHMQSLLQCLRFLHEVDCPLDVRLSQLLFTEGLNLKREEFRLAAEGLERELWLSRQDESFACHDVALEAVPQGGDRFQEFVEFARRGCDGEDLALGLLRGTLSLYYQARIPSAATREDREKWTRNAVDFGQSAIKGFRDCGHMPFLATSLNNASGCYSELAGLETTREVRAGLLRKALDSIQEAITIRRGLGLQADLAASLNNASGRYSELAGLEATRKARAGLLRKALDSVQEAIRLYRGLSLQADLAAALNNASNRYSELAGLEATRKARAGLLRKALDSIQEAIRVYRGLGLQADLAMSLNNASNRYSELAGLEATRKARAGLLQKALDSIQEAIRVYRGLGLQANLAAALNNASNRYSELAGLEATRKARAGLLRKALDSIQEAIRVYRGLGLQADLAMSLGTANLCYRAAAANTEDTRTQGNLLRKARKSIEEAADIFRAVGNGRYLAQALRDNVICHLDLARLEPINRTRVCALCGEGEELSCQLGDDEKAAFFAEVKEALSQG